MEDPTSPVVVAQVATAVEARLLCHRLEEAGVPARLVDEHMVTLDGGMFDPALGGVKVVVPAAQAEQARPLLRPEPGAREPRAPTTKAGWVDGAFRAALLGVFVAPFLLLTLALLVGALRAPSPWTRRSRRKAWTSLGIAGLGIGLWIFVILIWIAIT
ncbi:MAG: putative signal transducing protein [Planctomycetota bacterium]